MKTRSVEAVVTFLEMNGPPGRLPPEPPIESLALVRVDAIPLHYYRYLYRTVGAPWLWFERLLLDDAALAKRIHRPSVEIYVLQVRGAPAGYYELDFADPDSVALVYFGLMPEWTGRGIGGWFLGSAIATGFSRGASNMRVNTCTLDHPAALPLYRKLGFRPVSKEARLLRVPAHLDIAQEVRGRLKA
jgi:GNAT superfamily N-acetyltransferase